MLRFTGAICISAACTMYGFISADRLRKRFCFLREFVTSLSVLETEIEFGRYELERIFRSMGDKRELCGIYGICAESIKERGIKAAWAAASDAAADAAALKREDISAVKSLGAELGKSDVRGQKNAIRRTKELAAVCEAAAGDEYKRLGRAYRICGALAGVFCVLMIW